MSKNVRVEMPWVIHEGTFYYQCICSGLLEIPGHSNRNKKLNELYKTLLRAEDYVKQGTWMDCPSCKTRFMITSVHYDNSESQSGTLYIDISPASGALNPAGKRLLMIMDGVDDE